MHDLSLLVLSYHFPPSGAVGGKRIAYFCRYLGDFGIRTVVVALDPSACESMDDSFDASGPARLVTVVPKKTIRDRYCEWRQSRTVAAHPPELDAVLPKSEPPSLIERVIRRNMSAALEFPDFMRGWYRPALQAVDSLLGTIKFDAVLSSAPPWTAHFLGYRVSRRYRLPWIADFRDGWVGDAWYRRAPGWRSRLDWFCEDRWLRHASMTVCTTNALRQRLLGIHPAADPARVVTITNGIDDEIQPASGLAKSSSKRLMLHLGSIYAGRRIDTFFEALSRLIESGRIAPTDTEVLFLGTIDDAISAGARNRFPLLFKSGLVSFRHSVKWKEAQKLTNRADVLMIFQGDHPTAVPGKFFEYLQSGNPMLVIVGDGELRDLVANTRSGFLAYPNDPNGIVTALSQALDARPRPPEEVSRLLGQFHFRNLTHSLAEHIRSVVGKDRASVPSLTARCATSQNQNSNGSSE